MNRMKFIIVALVGLSACAHNPCVSPERAMSQTLRGDPQDVFDCWREQEPDTKAWVWKCLVATSPDNIYKTKTVRRLNVCDATP